AQGGGVAAGHELGQTAVDLPFYISRINRLQPIQADRAAAEVDDGRRVLLLAHDHMGMASAHAAFVLLEAVYGQLVPVDDIGLIESAYTKLRRRRISLQQSRDNQIQFLQQE